VAFEQEARDLQPLIDAAKRETETRLANLRAKRRDQNED
jgi:hypothetical protein